MNDAVAYGSFLSERRAEILGRVARACDRAGRDVRDVRICAVSKTVDDAAVRAAVAAGWTSFGENRPQELVRKTDALEDLLSSGAIRFDMIGNLQKNKINQVLGRADLIHSVSSAHLAESISARAEAKGIRASVLLEVNVSGEMSKSGFSPDALRMEIEGVSELAGIAVRGLMTMAPAGDPDAARASFRGLRELAFELRERSGLALETLSCGMSDDFEIAIEEGSTCVRLGRIVFDPGYAFV